MSATAASRPERPRLAVVGEKALEALIRLAGVSAILFVAAIFFFVLREAIPVLGNEKFSLSQFLFSVEWYPTSAKNVRYGTFALTVGTLSVTALAILLAVPFGLGAAVYLSEFCSPRLRETLKVVIELLSAIPSVVWGFVGLTVTSRILVSLTGAPIGVNLLNGAVLLALMSVPVIVSIGEQPATREIVRRLLERPCSGATNICAALEAGAEELSRGRDPRRAALLVSDGLYTLGPDPRTVAPRFASLHVLHTLAAAAGPPRTGAWIAPWRQAGQDVARLGGGHLVRVTAFAELPRRMLDLADRVLR